MDQKNYIKDLRSKVGHEKIFLNFACACVTNDQGEILLQKRSATEDLWGFPGGALELDESAEAAAIREVKEETGLEIKADYLIGVYTLYFAKYPNGDESQNIVIFFKATLQGGDFFVDKNETFDLKFFAPQNLPTLFNPQHQDMLKDYLAKERGVCR